MSRAQVELSGISNSNDGFNASLHNLFFDFREFYPPMSILVSLQTEDATHTTTVPGIKQQKNELPTAIGFVKKNTPSLYFDLPLAGPKAIVGHRQLLKTLTADRT